MNNTIGSRIRDKRKELGMSQEELAEKLYTSKQMISAYENDKTEIKVSVLKELAVALDTTTSFLVDGEYTYLDEEINKLVNAYIGITDIKIRRIALMQLEIISKEC